MRRKGYLMDKMVAWGSNNEGQLGDGTRTTTSRPVLVPGLPEKKRVSQLAAGFEHSLALLDDGTVWAWGCNGWGVLGHNAWKDSLTPIQVVGEGGKGWLMDVVEIAAGKFHNLARKEDGTLWAWGDGVAGQLGTGDRSYRLAPARVNAWRKGERVTAIAAGKRHSLAITTLGDVTTVWAWGHNSNGQLGRPPASDYDVSLVPVPVIDNKERPSRPYQAVAAGGEHCLALRADGVVEAWGKNAAGQLGDGKTNDRARPGEVDPVLPHGPGVITQIAAGNDYSLALATDLSGMPGVWAWGYNRNGQLGDGHTLIDRPLPDRVVGPGGEGHLTKVSAIAAGDFHCLALRGTDHTVWAWGHNGFGQLGDGTNVPQSTEPVQAVIAPLLGPNAMEHIGAGYMHSLAAGLILRP
jgi:alpha-tubulin suppressor-like RCC1 family protein